MASRGEGAYGVAMETGEIRRNCLAACAMTDAEGYTGIAEGMDPPGLVDLVNRYFKGLFGAVLEHGGLVVDVKGDGIVAVWTSDAPDPVLRAQVCAACLAMLEAADSFNRSSPGRRLPTRVGVDFGPIALAKVGAFARYAYRALGDTVNTSSRLEELNKLLGTRLLVSAELAEGVEGFLFRDLGEFVLRGKRAPVRVLELLGSRSHVSREQVLLRRGFAGALEAHQAGDADQALLRFSALRARFPHDGPTQFFLRHCSGAAARPSLRYAARAAIQ